MTTDARPFSTFGLLLALLRRPFVRRREKLDARIAATRERAQFAHEDKIMLQNLSKEGKDYIAIIQRALVRLGEFYAPSTVHPRGRQMGGRRRSVQMVQFSHMFCSPEIIYLRILVNRPTILGNRSALPHQVRVADLMSDKCTYELSAAVERRVSWQFDPFLPEEGAHFMVHRLEGTGGIPKLIGFQDMLEHAPEDMSGLELVIGVGPHRRVKTMSMYESPGWLIAGPIRSGKSNLLNSLILQLMYHTTPEQVRFAPLDMKEGLELGVYADSPYLWCPIAVTYEAALDVLQDLHKEILRRLQILQAVSGGRAKDYRLYNALYPKKTMPAIICVIDEAAQLTNMGNQRVKNEAEEQIAYISAIGRAAGVYMIVCTQQPTIQVISSVIKANLPVRVAFRCSHQSQSGVIIGRGDAFYLPDVKGRCLYVDGADTIECQTPLVRPDDLDMVLKNVAERFPRAPMPAPAPAMPVLALPAPAPVVVEQLDHMELWLRDNVIRQDDARTRIALAYEDYDRYCRTHGHVLDQHSKKGFAQRLYNHYGFRAYSPGDGSRCVKGLLLKTDIADSRKSNGDLYDTDEAAR